jgi:hypothetical protein
VLAHRRDIAQRINANEPAWDVMFGLGSRKFWAFPYWRGAPDGLVVSAADPSELLGQMRAIETRHAGPIAAAAAILDRRGGEAAPHPLATTARHEPAGCPPAEQAPPADF